jgi:hypothetical protein
MSVARQTFCDRIATIKEAIASFNLRDLPPTPANTLHNNSARIIRNGLGVQCFSIFEDFIKARMSEVLVEISASGLPFTHLPEDLQWAVTVDAVKAIEFQLRLRDSTDRIRYAQDYSEKISSTKLPAVNLAEIAFFHSGPNIAKDHFREALAAFAIGNPWAQCSALCSRIGISGVPAETVLYSFAQRRHRAAHNANSSISEVDLTQSLLDASGLAFCFDVLISKASNLICRLKAAHPTATWLIQNQASIPLRFIRFVNNRFCETKEGGKRNIRTHLDSTVLIPGATRRTLKENGALVILDRTGVLSRWVA